MSEIKKEDAVAATLADPQYKAGRRLIDDDRLEDAVNFFSGLLETRVALLGDEMSPALAPLYYEYGNSLLYNAEESGDVFGDAITGAEKKKALEVLEAHAAAAGGAPSEEQEEGDDPATAAVPGAAPAQEAEEDLEIAWENLEMARRIYTNLELTEEIRTAIAKVHLRLGDLNMVNGMYNEAADEFEKCLVHRLALPCPQSRRVADAHVRKAQALFYASTLEGAEKEALVARSLEQYRLAASIFEALLAFSREKSPLKTASPGKENSAAAAPATESSATSNGSSNGESSSNGKGKASAEQPPPPAATASAASGSAEELQDGLDAIRETIETMVSGKDMEALAEYKSGAASTTVGFGDAASAFSGGGSAGGSSSGGGGSGNGAAGEVTTIGFGASSSTGFGSAGDGAGFGGASIASSSGAGAGATANVMVVKRKVRPVSKVIPTCAGAGAAGAGASASTGTSAAAGGGSGSADGVGDVSKKAKNNE